MNKLTIIGNLTRDPELRTTQSGKEVCSFTVAVNRRMSRDEQQTDFFRVTAWDKLAGNCHQYLAKGRKVCVIGAVSVSTYEAKDGSGTRFSLDVNAQDVEFLSSRESSAPAGAAGERLGEGSPSPKGSFSDRPKKAPPAGTFEVDDDDLPF